MDIRSNIEEFAIEINDLVKLFDVEINLCHNEQKENRLIINEYQIEFNGESKCYQQKYTIPENISSLREKSIRKSELKIQLYDILSTLTKTTLPWGSLTGVRPTKFARELIERGEANSFTISDLLEKKYRVRKDKAKLVSSILKNQKCIIRNDNLVDLYVNIPICPSRCQYCSFISSELKSVEKLVDTYLDCVLKELDAIKKIIFKNSYVIRTIYVGGGTPSVLNEKQLDRLLSNLSFEASEFTVECGRPDTITIEKLKVLKKYKVTRISINPQTFCEATLKRIGRNHKNVQVLNAYSMALEQGFIVNMDIIAGLPGEKLGIFKRTMSTLLELYPENITIHTLSVKNGSLLKEQGEIAKSNEVGKMVDYGQKLLMEKGYKPYYLYRQKNQLGGLENVGFFRDENVCIFNIDSMEETNTIIAVGANAMSKRVFNTKHFIDRQSNCKFLQDYIARIDEIIEKKNKFFE